MLGPPAFLEEASRKEAEALEAGVGDGIAAQHLHGQQVCVQAVVTTSESAGKGESLEDTQTVSLCVCVRSVSVIYS